MDWDTVLFNISAFIAGLFVLEYGADAFVDHTAIVARRCGVSQTLVALITAGAEWEELAVVIASLAQHRQSLAIGNVVGSSISNILGAFSLGLLFTEGRVHFDSSAKVYTSLLFALTTVIAFLGLVGYLNKAVGAVLIVVFGIYVVSIGWAIYQGVVEPPVDSDSDSESDSDEGSEDGDGGQEIGIAESTDEGEDTDVTPRASTAGVPASETSALLPRSETPSSRRKYPHSLTYHITYLFLGFLALSLSGYILSHSAATLADTFHLSGTVLGITILAFATTLPEKFVAVISGQRGHHGIVVANTAGSNVFLLSLCLGIALVCGDGESGGGAGGDVINGFEIMTLWVSSAALFLVVWVGGDRYVGGLMLVVYLVFIVLEFTLFRR